MALDSESLVRVHEEAFVASFIVHERRERYLSQLRSIKKRAAFLDRLNHRFVHDLDSRFIAASPSLPETSDATMCCVMASESKFDRQLVTPEVVEELLLSANFGIVVSFIPGKLAVYKDEVPSRLIWLERQ